MEDGSARLRDRMNALGSVGGKKVKFCVLQEHYGFAVFDFSGENHLKDYFEV